MRTDPGNELVDVLDDQGRILGTVPRAGMRARRLPHRCVYLLVFNRRGELFLHLRTAAKDVYPSHWDVTIGGVLTAGESFEVGGRREAREELGVEVELKTLFPFRYADETTVVHSMVYRVEHEGPFRLQTEEIVSGEFVPLAEVAERIRHQAFCPDGLAVLQEFQRRGLGSVNDGSAG
jgi:isopentenyldiphosphate isomerase